MDALSQEIGTIIRLSVHKYIKIVSDKYEIDFDDLISIWENSDTKNTPKPTPKKTPKPTTTPKTTTTPKSPSEASSSSDGCPYIYTKGEKEGQSCGIKPKGGVIYCTRHKKYEGQEPKQKKIVPCAKKSIAGSTPSKVAVPVAKEVNTVLRKNKAIDKLWHSSTGMVFKSARERVVIGKCVDDKFLPLDKDDINICMAHSFAYDVSSYEDEEESIIDKKKDSLDQKKSISTAIKQANIKAADVEDILCELQISKKKLSSILDDEEDEDEEEEPNDYLEEEEDLLEEEDE
ncbi:MAG: hypothetical protein EB127_28975 [Alphaproteobacteria bacterium]|uniref:Uncharacterized protein n=1 Tax=viral metagenome TaxID=1070528 RepID=A0A6C0H2R3_9ZZZZ|nr:hypothetical protein [Alphaproteobacteria bacterium]